MEESQTKSIKKIIIASHTLDFSEKVLSLIPKLNLENSGSAVSQARGWISF